MNKTILISAFLISASFIVGSMFLYQEPKPYTFMQSGDFLVRIENKTGNVDALVPIDEERKEFFWYRLNKNEQK